VINVVDLMTLQDQAEHPNGLSHKDFDTLFTTDKPIIFAYHGYPWLIHRLTYRRTNHKNLHVRGYKEEGTTTRSTWWCAMTWTVSTWWRMSLIGFRNWGHGPPISSNGCVTG